MVVDWHNDRRRRRQGGFLPTNITNLAFWLRADKGVTTSGGAVSQWDFDTAFRGVSNVAQATGANQPSHTVSDSAYNNQSTISFDGGDYLDGANWSSALAQPNYYFIVGNVGGIGEAMIDRAGGTGRNLIAASTLDDWQMYAGTSLLSAGATDTSKHLFEATFDGVSSALVIDGVSIMSGDAGAQSLDSLRVGENIVLSGGLTGKIAEIAAYTAEPSAADKTLLRNYGSSRYDISI